MEKLLQIKLIVQRMSRLEGKDLHSILVGEHLPSEFLLFTIDGPFDIIKELLPVWVYLFLESHSIECYLLAQHGA